MNKYFTTKDAALKTIKTTKITDMWGGYVEPEQCECCSFWSWSAYYDGMIVAGNGEPYDRICEECDREFEEKVG